ncbi:MAG TPA: glycosyltransferase family 2 protein [Chitinophagaceae bacterium]
MQLSVLIRNLNEGKQLEQTLCSLKRQCTDFEHEVVVIDNESDDNSVEIAKQMGCKVFTLKRAAFTFGHALNYGIKKCQGEIILILSAHVILLNEFFLQNIPQYFDDLKVAGLRFVHAVSPEQVVDGIQNGPQQLIYSDSSNFVLDNWKNFIVNHCAAVRKSYCEEVGFNEQVFASEDKIWSLAILKKGYSILYDVPGFYVYAKPFNRTTKIKRATIEEAAKQLITGETEATFSLPYPVFLLKRIGKGLKQTSKDIRIHSKIYKGIRILTKKYKSTF